MKRRFLSAALTLCLLLSLLPTAALAAGKHPFTDVPASHWANDAVAYVYAEELMGGMEANAFYPNYTTTRGMIVTILYRLDGTGAKGKVPFTDVAQGSWYYDAVGWASANGIVGGYGDGKFGPNDTITREQMALILFRYADSQGYDVSARASLSGYQDAGAISSYAKEAMAWANGVGLISGLTSDSLSPKGSATRAQAAAIFTRFCQQVVPNGYVSHSQMVQNLKKSSLSKKDTLASMAQVMLDDGFAPAFVAGVLGNIIAEGACGIFEYSTYSIPENKPAYLVYMEENYDYQNVYSGKYIYNGFSLSQVYDMILELGPGGANGRGSCFGLGCLQWTDYTRIKRLLENYMAVAGSSDTITLAQVQKAEGMTISYELNGPYKGVYTAWQTENPNRDTMDAAYDAGVKICTSYGIPAGYNTEAVQSKRAGYSTQVYAVMLGQN